MAMGWAIIFSRRMTKGCFRRVAVLSPLSDALVPQLSRGSAGAGYHSAEVVRSICAQSAWQLQRRGGEDVRRGFVDLRDWASAQQRWYARSNNEKAKPDPDTIATEMIKYAASCRSVETYHAEAVRVLEQGRLYLLSEGSSAATAHGRVLLTLATFYVDRAKFTDAVDALQGASDLEPAGLGVRVAALEALAGLCLRLHQEEPALKFAHSSGLLVTAAGDAVPTDELKELQFRSKAVAALAALVCARCGAVDTRLFEDVPTWLGENSRRTAGVAAAMFSLAQCAHVGGYFKIAGELYGRTIAIIRNSKDAASEGTLASVAMAPDEVHVGALAGLGQLASHIGKFDEAEGKITEALTLAEKINGDKHPRVGVILACLADVYARRERGTGDNIIPEGLYRRCLEYLGSPSIDVPDTGKQVDFVDIMALSRARYAEIISKSLNRGEEADKLQKWASKMWKGPRPLMDLMKVDSAQTTLKEKSKGSATNSTIGKVEGHVVIDVRLGRVIWKVSS
ncbi:hypothetical protein M758_2G193400 [Ceratodon purpureus]|nr:hypothetical protein M758_2G193400 [Ceratodon purpureus]